MGRRLHYAFAFTLVLVSSGARAQAPAPAQPPEAPQPPPAPEEPQLPDVKDPMLEPVPQAGRVLRSWREALRLVRTRSTTLRTTRAQIDQARGRAREALAGTLPTLTGTASVTRHILTGTGPDAFSDPPFQTKTLPDPLMNFNAAIELRQPLLALRTWHDIGTVNRSVRAAQLTSKDTERILLATVADAAVGVITAERLADVSRVALASALSTLELTRRRANLGAATKLDVLRADQEVSLSRAQVVNTTETLRRARETLGLTLGYDEPWGVTPEVSLQDLARTGRAVCRPVENIEARSDIEAAALGVEIAERNNSSVDYSYVPTVDLGSTMNYLIDENRSPNREHVTWTVGAFLTWPFYDGGFRYGERTRTQAESQIARETLTEAQRTARIEVVQAQRAVSVARANLEVSRHAEETAKETARLAKVAFINGSGTSFDLVDTAGNLREADIDLALKEFELIRAQVAAFLSRANCGL